MKLKMLDNRNAAGPDGVHQFWSGRVYDFAELGAVAIGKSFLADGVAERVIERSVDAPAERSVEEGPPPVAAAKPKPRQRRKKKAVSKARG